VEGRGRGRREGEEIGGERRVKGPCLLLNGGLITSSFIVGCYCQWLHAAGTGRNGVPPPVSGVTPPEIAVPQTQPKVVVPPPGNDVPSPSGGKSLKSLPLEVRF